ncbi:MAG: peptidase M28 family protein [Myxococcales bacterium]|nr:peptidase M28 family protein [Myxococcales bacterium]
MRRPPLALALALALLAGSPAAAAPAESTVAARITGAALIDGQSYAIVQSLTDKVGHRLAGTPSAERAVEWALKEMARAGLSNVHREKVMVPRWVRGEESVELLAPSVQSLHALTLGNSVGTPPGGITAEVIEVTSLDEAKALGEKAKGKIVLFNKAMNRVGQGFDGYGAVVPMRGAGAIEAARNGAVAALIRSVGTGAYRLPHTGATHYDDKVTKIPFAAITAEDADLIHRWIAAGETVKVRMRLGAKNDGEVESANVVGDLPGREKPEEIVLLGAHLDSWDVGTGAIDDGAGCAIVIEAARLLRTLGLTPRRTVRVVLFMNEEHGLSGARAYAERHDKEVANHVAALEADSGAGRPLGFGVAGGPLSVALVSRLAAPLAPLRTSSVKIVEAEGADLIPLQARGVPVLGLLQDMTTYFDWHHTNADTLDKIDPIDLALNAAAMAVMAHAVAEMAERLPPSPPPPKW